MLACSRQVGGTSVRVLAGCVLWALAVMGLVFVEFEKICIPLSRRICGQTSKVIGPLLPGGGANLRTFAMLGGGV
jgi:hypothetical protein